MSSNKALRVVVVDPVSRDAGKALRVVVSEFDPSDLQHQIDALKTAVSEVKDNISFLIKMVDSLQSADNAFRLQLSDINTSISNIRDEIASIDPDSDKEVIEQLTDKTRYLENLIIANKYETDQRLNDAVFDADSLIVDIAGRHYSMTGYFYFGDLEDPFTATDVRLVQNGHD